MRRVKRTTSSLREKSNNWRLFPCLGAVNNAKSNCSSRSRGNQAAHLARSNPERREKSFREILVFFGNGSRPLLHMVGGDWCPIGWRNQRQRRLAGTSKMPELANRLTASRRTSRVAASTKGTTFVLHRFTSCKVGTVVKSSVSCIALCASVIHGSLVTLRPLALLRALPQLPYPHKPADHPTVAEKLEAPPLV